MSSPFDSKEYKALEKIWYAKLKEGGFEDCESADVAGRPLKVHHNHYFKRRYSDVAFLAKQEYYQVCSNFLNTHTFKSAKERKIWELHCSGLSRREIGAKMKCSKDIVHKIIAATESLIWP